MSKGKTVARERGAWRMSAKMHRWSAARTAAQMIIQEDPIITARGLALKLEELGFDSTHAGTLHRNCRRLLGLTGNPTKYGLGMQTDSPVMTHSPAHYAAREELTKDPKLSHRLLHEKLIQRGFDVTIFDAKRMFGSLRELLGITGQDTYAKKVTKWGHARPGEDYDLNRCGQKVSTKGKNGKYQKVPFFCGRWACPSCGPFFRNRWIEHLIQNTGEGDLYLFEVNWGEWTNPHKQINRMEIDYVKVKAGDVYKVITSMPVENSTVLPRVELRAFLETAIPFNDKRNPISSSYGWSIKAGRPVAQKENSAPEPAIQKTINPTNSQIIDSIKELILERDKLKDSALKLDERNIVLEVENRELSKELSRKEEGVCKEESTITINLR